MVTSCTLLREISKPVLFTIKKMLLSKQLAFYIYLRPVDFQGNNAKEKVNPRSFASREGTFFFFGLFRATPVAYEGPQARGRIRAVDAGLPHNHNNARSQLRLQHIHQLTTTLDP